MTFIKTDMSVLENLHQIHEKIQLAMEAVPQPELDVQLVAVSKKQPDERIEEALAAGHRVFGENRVQEAQQRWGERRAQYPDLTLHLIGPLQTNKAKDAVALFDVIETLDREKLAKVLSKEMVKQERYLPCFIQVNTGAEPQKSGVDCVSVADFYEFCTKECAIPVTGLMCIPPFDEPPGQHFKLLAKLASDLGLQHLSMGMSGDYLEAIACGATYIRVGTGVFGERPS